MVPINENINSLRLKVKNEIDHLDSETIYKICSVISEIAAERMTKLADEAWDRGDVTREKIGQAVIDYRKSKKKS